MQLRLILGDQLNAQHSWFQATDDQVLYVMMEMRQETDYVRHHIQKVIAFFGAMRAFAQERQAEGHRLIYLKINDPNNTQSLTENLRRLMKAYPISHFAYQNPDEYRLDKQLRDFTDGLAIPVTVADTEHFLVDRFFVRRFFAGKKMYLLESFYRQVRKDFELLMENEQPIGGQWNYDAQNRKKYDGKQAIPEPLVFVRDVRALLSEIEAAQVETIGKVDPKNFTWALTRQEALQLLDYFNAHLLPHFGTYQDAMVSDEPYLFHSRLSFAINAKILSPLEVVQSSIAAWRTRPEAISLAQIEGFVRQIIGWREYMRGIYWDQMPGYAEMNFFGHQHPLPSFYWTGKTKMHCLGQAIGQSLDHAYAHHIQRLMITGNFALLAGIAPDQVDQWYLGIYADAIEWVEITNTRGMSQFADGGIVGTKPYVSSANYIQKMSNYCKNCDYDPKKRHGDKACPFNSLYWDFHARNRESLEKNPRIGMVYRTWDKMNNEERGKTLAQADAYLERLDEL
ncbi:MAG: cryptochrome/photolyase family protein [Bernardetiaceae bacterium]